MGHNVTDSALRFMSGMRRVMSSGAYIAVLRAAERIRHERGASWLGRIHLEMALDEQGSDAHE